MSSVVIAGDTSGTVTLAAPAVAGTTTLTLPTTSGTLVTTSGSQTIEFADGSASTPSITNSGDTNTGMFFPAADTIAFAEGGTEAMRIDSSGNVGIGTASPAGDSNRFVSIAAAGGSGFFMYDTNQGSTVSDGANIQVAGTNLYIYNKEAGFFAFGNGNIERMRIDSSGGLILAGSTAQKASGTTWSNPSDQRLKDNIRDYTKGTTELMQVRVREWEYNGKGGTTEGLKGLGVVADEVMTVLPNTVETYDAKLNADDEETTAIKKFDATEITWLLVKTVQEQQTIINDLKARIETLEAK
jgi:hypothetical protein